MNSLICHVFNGEHCTRTVGPDVCQDVCFAENGEQHMGEYLEDGRPSTYYSNTTFSVAGLGRMRKIYCKCGRIIGMDSNQMKLKLDLGKDLECTCCRNARISKDIDELNTHFGGIEEEIF